MTTPAPPTRDDLLAVVTLEARLLDEKRYDAWCALFAEQGVYWVPLQHDQTNALHNNSLMYEDKLLLQLRIQRLAHARAFSQHPPSRSLHVLQQPSVERFDPPANSYLTRTPFTYLEARGDEQLVLGGVAGHTFVVDDGGQLKILQKRIDLLNCDAALPSVQLFL